MLELPNYTVVIFSFPDFEYASVQTLVDQVRHAHYRLVWVTGGTSASRTKFLAEMAEKLGCPLLNVGKALASAMVEQPVPLRPASAEEAFYDTLHTSKSDLVCLDHLDILFDAPLMLKAVDLVRNASRRHVLLASWPGIAESGSLTFAPADHPSHFRIPLSALECPVHTLSQS